MSLVASRSMLIRLSLLTLLASSGCVVDAAGSLTSEQLVSELSTLQPGDTLTLPAGTFAGSFTVPAGVTLRGVEAHAVVKQFQVAWAAPMNAELRHEVAAIAADILGGGWERRANDQRGKPLQRLASRHHIENPLREHALLTDILDVHDRAGAHHGDRLQHADAHLRVRGRREASRELKAFPPEHIETRQCERHRVHTRPEIHDLVIALAVCHDHADLFDEGRARGLHRDAGQHRARRVLDDPRDGAGQRRLRPGSGRDHHQNTHNGHTRKHICLHNGLLITAFTTCPSARHRAPAGADGTSRPRRRSADPWASDRQIQRMVRGRRHAALAPSAPFMLDHTLESLARTPLRCSQSRLAQEAQDRAGASRHTSRCHIAT